MVKSDGSGGVVYLAQQTSSQLSQLISDDGQMILSNNGENTGIYQLLLLVLL